jgi:hypothetical protein
MSLPACQERILGGIERALRTAEPRLASRFAMFTRLTRDEELPSIEQLVPPPWRPWRWLTRAGTAGCDPSQRSRPGNGTPARARRAVRLRRAVVVPVVLIAMASALLFASFSGAARTCAGPHRRTAAVTTRWVTCAAAGAQAPGARSAGTSGAGGGR